MKLTELELTGLHLRWVPDAIRTPVMIRVVDAAVAKAYGGKRKIHWMEVYAGEKSTQVYGPDVWLPEETLAIVRDQEQ